MDMTQVARRALLFIVMVASLALSACSPSPASHVGQRVVFAVATGFGQGMGDITTIDTVDVGIPDLHNVTDRAVRIRAVSIPDVPPAVRLDGVTAHPGQGVGIITGNLVKLCRTTYPTFPVTDAVTRPHAESTWHLVLAITFTQPGKYYLRRARIYYTTNGQNGWQYQNLFTTISVSQATASTKPRFDGCP
jgi:hypothetical protein